MAARNAPYGRWLALVVLGVLGIPLYARILAVAGLLATQVDRFTLPELGALAVAVIAAALVLASRPAASRRLRWIELALLLGFGVAFRAVFFAATPAISHDAYRYVWDAHLLANGVSPWTHALSDSALTPLRDTVIFPRVNWRGSPTIYPPGAQLVFLLVNTASPLNIAAMKWAMTLCDFGIGALTLVLLRQRGQDPRRVVLYWWSPLPIVEFTFNAHVDAVATLWMLAVFVVLAREARHTRSARLVAGVLLALAAATKLYPLLFAVALLRPSSSIRMQQTAASVLPTSRRHVPAYDVGASGRRPLVLASRFRLPLSSWERGQGVRSIRRILMDPLLLALGASLVLIYLPFAFIGLGNGGFLATYFGQRFVDQGILFRLITTVFVFAPLQLALQGLALGGLCGLVAWLRVRRGLDMTAGVLAVSAIWIALSPHLLPWYGAGLLPLLALHLRLPYFPSPTRRGAGSEVYPLALYLFVLAMPFTYVIFAPSHDANLFVWFFYVPLAIAAVPWLARAVAPVRDALTHWRTQSSTGTIVGAPAGHLPSPTRHATRASASPSHAPAIHGRDAPLHQTPDGTTQLTTLQEHHR